MRSRSLCVALALVPLLACSAAAQQYLSSMARRVALPTGVSLNYVEVGPRSAPAVILLHGFIDSHQAFEPVIPTLSQRFHLYLPDQRGHGDSDKPECCYSQADFVADLREFMRELSIPRATLVGHSMGVAVAHKFALEHPEMVEGLVLIGGAPVCMACRNPKAEIMEVRDPIDPEYVRELQKSSMYAPVPGPYFERVISQSMKVPANVWHQAWKGMAEENHADRLSEIRARTLIVGGEKDRPNGPEVQQQLARLIPDSTLLIYEETGHWPYAEQTGRFLRDFIAWMQNR